MANKRSSARDIIFLLFVLTTLLCLVPRSACAETRRAINGFFLNNVPSKYEDIERLFHDLKLGGANTLILPPPFHNGVLNGNMLTNEVFIAHREGLNIFIVLPTRGNRQILEKHPEWEDRRYNLRTGSLERTGRIDLFYRAAIDAVAASVMEVAAYSVDGILLDTDFYYGETEGMSPIALKTFRQIFNREFSAREAFGLKTKDGHVQHGNAESADMFWNWTGLKKNMLLNLYKGIAKAAWSVNPKVRFGIPLHLDGFNAPGDELARFGYDFVKFKKIEIDYYWIAVRYRDIRAEQRLTYSKSMETLSRIATAATSLSKEPEKTIIAIQTADPSGKILPLTEIEEATEMVKHSGDPGLAFIVTADMPIDPELTGKIFKR